MTCLQCGRSVSKYALNDLASGTGYCNQCAQQRLTIAVTRPEAKAWLNRWRGKFESCLAITRRQA